VHRTELLAALGLAALVLWAVPAVAAAEAGVTWSVGTALTGDDGDALPDDEPTAGTSASGPDADGDGLPDDTERAIGTDVSDPDTDGDGLLDGWEVDGYDADGDGTVEVPLSEHGANPLRKDVFVEVDSLTTKYFPTEVTSIDQSELGAIPPGNGSTNDFVWWIDAPFNASERHVSIEEAFAEAPVENPDGSTGITLHVDTGDLGGGEHITNPPADPGKPARNLRAFQAANMSDARADVFHYALIVPSADVLGAAYGDSFYVNNGVNDSRSPGPILHSKVVATFMHELGHSLGFFGPRFIHTAENYTRSQYTSVMSYAVAPDPYLDFSDECAFDGWEYLEDTDLSPGYASYDGEIVYCYDVEDERDPPSQTTVNVTVRGGRSAGTVTVGVLVDGTRRAKQTLSVSRLETTTVSFDVGFRSAGNHTVTIRHDDRNRTLESKTVTVDPPTAAFGVDERSRNATHVVYRLDGGEADADGRITDYRWSAGRYADRVSGLVDGRAVQTVAIERGSSLTTLPVELTVTDDVGLRASTRTLVSVPPPNDPPTAALAIGERSRNATHVVYRLDASGSSDDGSIADYGWSVDGHHDRVSGLVDGPAVQTVAVERGSSNFTVTLDLTVTDSDGASDTTGDTLAAPARPCSLSAVAARYDADGNCAVSLSELGSAASDYANDTIRLRELGSVSRAYANNGSRLRRSPF